MPKSKSRCLAFVISRAASPDRLLRLRDTLTKGRATAGSPCDWLLWANSPQAFVLAEDIGIDIRGNGTNVGQHVAFSEVLEEARCANYEYLLRVDDDADFITRNWLRRLIEVSEEIYHSKHHHAIIAPRVLGLKNPIEVQGTLATKRGVLQFVRITGGVCRLMPLASLGEYIPDVRQAMGAGEATSLATYCTRKVVPMFIVPWVRVRHQTEVQEAADAGYFDHHKIFQAIPYVPPLKVEEPA